jgi:RNA polymerase sigma-70 factor, ECF subfamily
LTGPVGRTSEVGVTGPGGAKGLGGANRSGGPTARRAWSDWIAAHGPTLLLLARQWVPDRADAEDVVQEAFLRFWRSRDRATDPAAYLYGCLRGCALEWSRGERRRRGRESAAAMEADAAAVGGLFCPHEQAASDERRQLIEAALGRLPVAQREVLVMKVWGGLTFPQIAAALDIPRDTAASRYRYALAKLREELAEQPSA